VADLWIIVGCDFLPIEGRFLPPALFLGGRAIAMDRRNKRIRGKVVSASPKIVVLKTSRGTRRLSQAVWTIAPIEGESRMPKYVCRLC
jgi:hypothetical protein